MIMASGSGNVDGAADHHQEQRGGTRRSLRSWMERHKGWLVIAVGFVDLFLALGIPYNYSIIFLSFKKEFNKNAALTGWPGSIANALTCAGGPVSTPVLRRFGPRVTTALGALLSGGGLIISAFMPALEYTYITFGLMVGFGSNFAFQSACYLILAWFPEKNCSRANALSFAGPTLGMMTLAPMMNTLIETYGWRICLIILGAGTVLVCLACAAFTVEPARTTEPSKETSDSGGSGDASFKECGKARADESADRPQRGAARLRGLARILLSVDPWMLFLCQMFANLGLSFIYVNYASFMEHDLHFSRKQITLAIMLLTLSEIVGKVVLSVVGDHMPFLKIYAVAGASLLAGFVACVSPFCRTVALTFTLAIILGPLRGWLYGLPLSAARQIFDYKPGVVTTLTLMPWGIGIFLGAPLSGGLYDLTGDYTVSLLVIAAIFLCSAASALAIPIRLRLKQRAGRLRFAERKTSVAVVCVSAKEKDANESFYDNSMFSL